MAAKNLNTPALSCDNWAVLSITASQACLRSCYIVLSPMIQYTVRHVLDTCVANVLSISHYSTTPSAPVHNLVHTRLVMYLLHMHQPY